MAGEQHVHPVIALLDAATDVDDARRLLNESPHEWRAIAMALTPLAWAARKRETA